MSSDKGSQNQYFKPRPELPVDRGWAWFVMLGAAVNSLFGYGFLRSLSMFFMEFLDKFQEPASVTTLAFGLNTAAFSIFSFLVPPLFLSRFSIKTVSLIGAFVHAFSVMALAFAPNMACIYVLFITSGAAIPLIYVSQVVLLGVYFKKRLSIAMAIANLGISIATMGSPILTKYLLDEFGLQGALLIHGALNLNNIAACLLFRPPSAYATNTDSNLFDSKNTSDSSYKIQKKNEHQYSTSKFNKDDGPSNSLSQLQISEKNQSLENDTLLGVATANNKSGEYRNKPILKLKLIDDSRKTKSLQDIQQKADEEENSNKFGSGSQNLSVIGKKLHVSSERNIVRSILSLTQRGISVSKLGIPSSESANVYVSNSSVFMDANGIAIPVFGNKQIKHVSETDSVEIRRDAESNLNICEMEKKPSRGKWKVCCFNSSSKMKKNNVYSSIQLEEIPTLENSTDTNVSPTEDDLDSNVCCKLYKSSDGKKPCCRTSSTHSQSPETNRKTSVFCNPIGLILIVMAGFGINTQCGAAYMPSLGKEQGTTDEQAALLMTVLGACDFCKIGLGYLADKGWFRRIHIVLVCQIIIAAALFFVAYFKGFAAMVILCVLFGSTTEACHVLLPGITIDLLGVDWIGRVMSGYFMLNGAVMTLTHFMVGWLKDETGSFVGGYQFIAGLVLVSASSVLVEKVIKPCTSQSSDSKNDTKIQRTVTATTDA